jgi:hypothetical protein
MYVDVNPDEVNRSEVERPRIVVVVFRLVYATCWGSRVDAMSPRVPSLSRTGRWVRRGRKGRSDGRESRSRRKGVNDHPLMAVCTGTPSSNPFQLNQPSIYPYVEANPVHRHPSYHREV